MLSKRAGDCDIHSWSDKVSRSSRIQDADISGCTALAMAVQPLWAASELREIMADELVDTVDFQDNALPLPDH